MVMVTRTIRNVMETEDSVACSQEPATNPLSTTSYCHALGDRRQGIGLTTGFIGSRYNYSYRVSQCTPFTTLY
jgi:hypothetical protein